MASIQTFTVATNECIAKNVYRMKLLGETDAINAPGQFVQIAVPGFYLRRPISVCDWDAQSLTLIYKTVGEGTQAMAGIASGEKLELLVGLGNGYDLADCGEKPMLIGGGVGVPPLYGLARCLVEKGVLPQVVLGFQTAVEVFLKEEFEALGCTVTVTTADGSMGLRGFVTDAIRAMPAGSYDYYYTCGPEPMLRAVYQTCPTSGQFSFEERMACGFGACMGCSCKTITGYKRICKEGPVLRKEEVLW